MDNLPFGLGVVPVSSSNEQPVRWMTTGTESENFPGPFSMRWETWPRSIVMLLSAAEMEQGPSMTVAEKVMVPEPLVPAANPGAEWNATAAARARVDFLIMGDSCVSSVESA